jgi:hypothetical protein
MRHVPYCWLSDTLSCYCDGSFYVCIKKKGGGGSSHSGAREDARERKRASMKI